MTEERFWSLFSARLAGEATPDELTELEIYLKENPSEQLRAGTIEDIWSVTPSISDDYKEAAFNKHLQRMSNHFAEPVLQYESESVAEPEEEKPLRKRPVLRIVAWMTAAAAAVVLGWFAYSYFPFSSAKNSNALAQNTVSTKRGSKSKIQLPDGTQVWLNADSKITYNENFQGKIREVQLSGEAFFDVVHDEERPFVIHTNVIDVKVLGTAFNVRSYADEKNTETSLIRGSVEITLRSNPDKKIILKPNDKLIVDNMEAKAEGVSPGLVGPKHSNRPSLLTLGKVNFKENETNALETLWVKNTLAFDKETFEEIALKIERWYDVKVKIADSKIKRTEFSGVFEDEDLEQVMEALRMTGNFHYDINKREVTIRQ
jgi:ferric-dicitrate binding protein FerR (iron transport regulator)